jgi:hypothetical protein
MEKTMLFILIVLCVVFFWFLNPALSNDDLCYGSPYHTMIEQPIITENFVITKVYSYDDGVIILFDKQDESYMIELNNIEIDLYKERHNTEYFDTKLVEKIITDYINEERA